MKRFEAISVIALVAGFFAMSVVWSAQGQLPLDGVHGNASQYTLFTLGPTSGVQADQTGETLLRVYAGPRGSSFMPENVVWWQKG